MSALLDADPVVFRYTFDGPDPVVFRNKAPASSTTKTPRNREAEVLRNASSLSLKDPLLGDCLSRSAAARRVARDLAVERKWFGEVGARRLRELSRGKPAIWAKVDGRLGIGDDYETALGKVDELADAFCETALVAHPVYSTRRGFAHLEVHGAVVVRRAAEVAGDETAAATAVTFPMLHAAVRRVVRDVGLVAKLTKDGREQEPVYEFRDRDDELLAGIGEKWRFACDVAPPTAIQIVSPGMRPLLPLGVVPHAKWAPTSWRDFLRKQARRHARTRKAKISTCEHCGREFPLATTGRLARYCCADCRVGAWRAEQRRHKTEETRD